MGLSIQPSLPGPLPHRAAPLPPAAWPASSPDRPAAGAAAAPDQADFSPVAVLLAQLQAAPQTLPRPLPAPGSTPARALDALLAQRLGILLQRAGLPTGPALAFEVDDAGRVRVEPGRADSAVLQRLVDDDPGLQALVRLLHAIQNPPAASAEPACGAAARPAPRGTDAAPVRPEAAPWLWSGLAPWLGAADRHDAGGWSRWLVAAALLLAIALWW